MNEYMVVFFLPRIKENNIIDIENTTDIDGNIKYSKLYPMIFSPQDDKISNLVLIQLFYGKILIL